MQNIFFVNQIIWIEIQSLTRKLWDFTREKKRPSHYQKHAYSNILKILQPKKENFQIKNSDIFPIPAQNIYCGYSLEPPRRGGSNEYPQSMFLALWEI